MSNATVFYKGYTIERRGTVYVIKGTSIEYTSLSAAKLAIDFMFHKQPNSNSFHL